MHIQKRKSMKIKFLSTLKKTAYQTVKIAGITLVMLMMAYGIDLTNDAAVSLAADYYYIDAASVNARAVKYSNLPGTAITDYSIRPEVWVNDGGKIKAKVYDCEYRDRNNIIVEDDGMYIRYAQNTFVRDGNINNGDHVYFCGIDCGRVSGIGTLHGKYVLFCPDWNNDYGHLMERGEVYNGVTIQTTGRLFFGRDSELTDECLQQLAAVGVNIYAPTQLTTRLYGRDSAYLLYGNEDYYAVDTARGCKVFTHHDHDLPYNITANYFDETSIFDTMFKEKNQDSLDSYNDHVWAEEAYRCDDADWLRGYEDSNFEAYTRKYPEIADVESMYGVTFVGNSHK